MSDKSCNILVVFPNGRVKFQINWCSEKRARHKLENFRRHRSRGGLLFYFVRLRNPDTESSGLKRFLKI